MECRVTRIHFYSYAWSRRPSQQPPRSSEGLLSFTSVFGSQPNQLRGDVTPDDEGPPRRASGTRGRRLARSVEEARQMGSPRGDHAMVHGARKSWASSGLLRKGMSLTSGSHRSVIRRTSQTGHRAPVVSARGNGSVVGNWAKSGVVGPVGEKLFSLFFLLFISISSFF